MPKVHRDVRILYTIYTYIFIDGDIVFSFLTQFSLTQFDKCMLLGPAISKSFQNMQMAHAPRT